MIKHCLVLSPTSLKPSLQEYVAVEPLIRDWKLTSPFSGAVRGLQVIAVIQRRIVKAFVLHCKLVCVSLPLQIGSSPDHFPPSRQTLFSSPFNLYPLMQLYLACDPSFTPSTWTSPFDGADNCGQKAM